MVFGIVAMVNDMVADMEARHHSDEGFPSDIFEKAQKIKEALIGTEKFYGEKVYGNKNLH